MEYLIAVFKSRAQVMKFGEKLKNYRIAFSVINTPREASLGCGLSIKFYVNDYEKVRRLLSFDTYPTFSGIFLVKESIGGQKRIVRPY